MDRQVPLVQLRGVGKRFDAGPWVLQGLSLEVAAGEFVSLIGPSGCGKSTLLRLVAALSRPTEGEILIEGKAPRLGERGTVFLFQEPTLLPWLTVRRNIEIPLRIRGVGRRQRQALVEAMLGTVRLKEAAGKYPRQLSGGMKMRASVARALAQAPRLLLMDEPFGALDEMTRHHLNEELLEMRERAGWTAFFVTHSVAEAVFLSSRILVMAANPGRIHADLRVDLPYPRTADTRETDAYLRQVAEVTHVLRSVEAGGEGGVR